MSETKTVLGVDRRLVIALGSILLLAAAWLLVLNPLLAGDDEPVEPAAAASEAAPTEEPSTEPTEGLPPIDETFEVFSARDPFEQLVVEPDPAVAAADPATSTTPTESATTVEGDPAKSSSSTTEDGTTVVVEDVFNEDGTDHVLLTANDKVYTLTAGDDFATNWRVEAIDDPCVTLLYGDQARLVCEGESVRK